MKIGNKFFLAFAVIAVFNHTIANETSQLDFKPSYSNTLPYGTLPLSSIMTILEQQGYTPKSVELENGHWLIKAYIVNQRNILYVLEIDPFSGTVLAEDIVRN
ncbi:PepSY domain-containing protein [Microbulbifer sp. GL-2]|uniref:PepSY domain-containing protein n=1 Tax=Microbulbifer sp. GL-2 TaxID=2591606 RepID=UPI0011654197|nr:PepSY domain-containing protein [Microbulbifer sp. GL-2]BBM00402.1 hypothetical protein GL2_04760 [Microbulbifer sp. GL-2]